MGEVIDRFEDVDGIDMVRSKGSEEIIARDWDMECELRDALGLITLKCDGD